METQQIPLQYPAPLLARAERWYASELAARIGCGVKSSGLEPFYKSIVALALTGKTDQAHQMAGFLVSHCFNRTEGRFVEASERVSYLQYSCCYRTSWILWGLVALSRADPHRAPFRQEVASISSFLKSLQDHTCGAVRSRPAQGAECDVLSTAVAGLSFLQLGYHDRAFLAADFLVEHIQQHQGQYPIRLRTSTTGKSVADIGRDSRYYWYPPIRGKPMHYIPALASLLLAKVAGVAGESRYCTGAKMWLSALEQAPDSPLTSEYCGKILWAAAEMVRLDSSTRYGAWVKPILDHLLSTQTPLGPWWVPGHYSAYGRQPLDFTLDRTGEYIAVLSSVGLRKQRGNMYRV